MTAMRYAVILSLALTLTATIAIAEDDAPTAQQVIDRIKANVNCEWSDKTVDTFKAGDPQTQVTGITTTFLATMDVLRKSAAAGNNLIITHEPTYYHGQDNTTAIEGDKVLAEKRAFIKEHGLVVWRFHDHYHRHQPDGMIEGMVDTLGWREYRRAGEVACFDLPKTTLRQLAEELKETFQSDSIRVIGRPDLAVSKAGLVIGAPGSLKQIQMLQREDIEVLVAGESREWETVEYARDAALQGRIKAMIILGHANSEDGGMEYLVGWLKPFVPEVPIQYIAAGEPFWSP